VIVYGITLKEYKFNYIICYYFMGSSLIFQFLYINVLNYRYFYNIFTLTVQRFLKIKKRWENKKKR